MIKKYIVSLSVFLWAAFLVAMTRPSFAATTIKMYYCKTADNKCALTSSSYSADANGVTSCQNNLSQYLAGQTTGKCYPTQAGCTSACTTTTFPCPSKCSGNYDYTRASAYTSSTSNCATPIANTLTYTCDCSCGASSVQHQNYQDCTQQCAQTVGKKMSYCDTTSKKCLETASPYMDKTACQANLAQFLAGKTTGICYDSTEQCNPTCGINATPAPVTICKTDFCGTTDEAGCLVTCCTKTPGVTRCVTKVGPTPTVDPLAPPPDDDVDEDQITPPPLGECSCLNESCTPSCKFDALQGFAYSPVMKCSLAPAFFTTAPSVENRNAWCKSSKKTKGDADGDGLITNKDYLYYVAVANGGKLPPTVNADFNGDGEIGASDRSIIIKSLGGI